MGSFFFNEIKVVFEGHAGSVIVGAVIIAIGYVMWRLIEPTHVSFSLKTTNTNISIRFGDLFASRGHIVIPVGEFFDSQLGEPVAPASVHGQFIQQVLQGNSAKFDADVERSLASQTYEQVARRVGHDRRYDIGTTAVLTEGARKYFLFALSKTDVVTSKASADVPQMWTALIGLWRKVRTEANGEIVYVPLVGGGLSGVGLEPIHLLRFLLLTVLAETRAAPITSQIEVILHRDLFQKIDLHAILKDWN